MPTFLGMFCGRSLYIPNNYANDVIFYFICLKYYLLIFYVLDKDSSLGPAKLTFSLYPSSQYGYNLIFTKLFSSV